MLFVHVLGTISSSTLLTLARSKSCYDLPDSLERRKAGAQTLLHFAGIKMDVCVSNLNKFIKLSYRTYPVVQLCSMKNLQEQLPKSYNVRVSKSYSSVSFTVPLKMLSRTCTQRKSILSSSSSAPIPSLLLSLVYRDIKGALSSGANSRNSTLRTTSELQECTRKLSFHRNGGLFALPGILFL